jgi:hypothetical protein
MLNTEQQISQYLFPFPDKIAALAQALRKYFIKETQPTMELVADSTTSVNIGYGFTEKAWDCYCAIIVYSKHINISFPSGAYISDPHGLLQGKGKRVRHIRVNELSEVKTTAVKALFSAARNNALENLEDPTLAKQPLKTIVKIISGIKKRPG